MIGPQSGVLLLLAALLATFLIPSMIYVKVAKRPRSKSVGLIWFIVHACLVIALAIDMLFQMRHSGEAVMGWLLVDLFDFPASVIHIGTDYLLSGTKFDTFWVSNYTLPLVGGLIFGSTQWGLVGWGIAAVSKRMSPSIWTRKESSNQEMHRTK